MNQRARMRALRVGASRAARQGDVDHASHSRYGALLALQRSVGNQQLSRMIAAQVAAGSTPRTIFRDVESAAQAFYRGGFINLKPRDLTAKFMREHGITKTDLEAIQARLTELRDEGGTTTRREIVDMTDPTNWPTAGGMVEEDARAVARHYGWVEVTESFECTDRAHTPKGRVYMNDEGGYLGADNTGHVGWGFKIWTKVRKGWLKYEGNMTWNGRDWTVNRRGT